MQDFPTNNPWWIAIGETVAALDDQKDRDIRCPVDDFPVRLVHNEVKAVLRTWTAR